MDGQGRGLRQDGAQRDCGGDRAWLGPGGCVGGDRGGDGFTGGVGQGRVTLVCGHGDQRERCAAAGGVDEVRGVVLADAQPAGLRDSADVEGEDGGRGGGGR